MPEPSIDAGLSYLFGENIPKNHVQASEDIQVLDIQSLVPGKFQPRKNFSEDSLRELSESIRMNGILQPLLVRPLENKSMYEIIAGERRWRAAKLCNLDVVPTIVKNVDDNTTAAFALIENIQRSDLNVIEEAEAYYRLIQMYGISHEEATKYIGKSRSHITNIIRLLGLSESVKLALSSGKLSMGHARALVTLEHVQQEEALDLILKRKLNTRQVEQIVRSMSNNGTQSPSEAMEVKLRRQYSNRLSKLLKTNVKVTSKGSKLKIDITLNSEEDLLRLVNDIEAWS